ncbi:hypothetical protein BN132_3988 [Cronobacter turicensis 564]|nr:hypothetical protein BN132_3988 [Cronobacter turicensis 564]
MLHLKTIFSETVFLTPRKKFVYKSIHSYYLFNKLIDSRGKYD